ncbi:fatty acid desaturase [Croceibacterium salegens]|nr:fatty acid desaturase [Croceibacterium salegens]
MAITRDTELHRWRRLAVMRDHPELTALMGPYLPTAGWAVAVVGVQVCIAAWIGQQPWWAIAITAYTVGAVASLSLLSLLHETSHDLVFRRPSANQWLGIFCGLPLMVPAATSYRKGHHLHHSHLGDTVYDGDFASPWEARMVGNCPLRKAMWLVAQPLLLSLRIGRMPGVVVVDRWSLANVAVQVVFDVAVVVWLGWGAATYLVLAHCFALGLHPLGGRWIQEHHIVDPGQVTYSYYGPMNRLVFNCGYHSEHHDLMRVPWIHLPKVRRIASEVYGPLHAHTSWGRLLVRFLFDRELTLANRTYGCGNKGAARKVTA